MKVSGLSAITGLLVSASVAQASTFHFWNLLQNVRFQSPVSTQETKVIPGDSPVDLCDAEYKQLLDIDYIDVDPNPPAKGENLTISAAGYLHTEVTEGAYVEVDVRYGYIRLLRQTIDLCEQLENVNLTCPLQEGKLDLTKIIELPSEIPPGKYLAFARAYTADDEFITCLSAQVEFSP